MDDAFLKVFVDRYAKKICDDLSSNYKIHIAYHVNVTKRSRQYYELDSYEINIHTGDFDPAISDELTTLVVISYRNKDNIIVYGANQGDSIKAGTIIQLSDPGLFSKTVAIAYNSYCLIKRSRLRNDY